MMRHAHLIYFVQSVSRLSATHDAFTRVCGTGALLPPVQYVQPCTVQDAKSDVLFVALTTELYGFITECLYTIMSFTLNISKSTVDESSNNAAKGKINHS